MVKKAKFYFPDGKVIKSDIIKESYQSQEILHNRLKVADSSCSFKVTFDMYLAENFKTQINSDKVRIEIKDEKGKNIGTFFVKNTLTFEKTQHNQPIGIQGISPSFFLNEDLPKTVVMLENTVEQIVKKLLRQIKCSCRVSIPVHNTLHYFAEKEGDNVKNIVDELLYEYGHVAFFDKDGNLTARNLFDVPEDTRSITEPLDGNSLRESIKVDATEHEVDFVCANYNKIEMVRDTLLFSDTQNADDKNKCKIEIKPGHYIFESDEEKKSREKSGKGKKVSYLDYDSTFGDVLYVSRIKESVIFDGGISHEIGRFDDEGNDLVNRASLVAYNNSPVSAWCRKLEIYGDAWIATSYDSVVSTKGTKRKDIDLKYVNDKDTASAFAVNVADWYRFSNFSLTVRSYVDYGLGTYVKVSDYGIGVYYGRIRSKKRTLKNDCIEYEIESMSDYVPCEIEKSSSSPGSSNASSTPGKPGAKGDKGEPGEPMLVYLEKDSLVIGIDGEVQSFPYTYTIPVHVVSGGRELPCKVGPITGVPGGMTVKPRYGYPSNAQQVIVSVSGEKGMKEAGSISIPIIYKEVEDGFVYGRHPPFYGLFGKQKDKALYRTWKFKEPEKVSTFDLSLDWNTARSGICRGPMNAVSRFLIARSTQVYFGDYFTWTASKPKFWSSPYTSENVLEMNDEELKEWNRNFQGEWTMFKPADVYKWNGVKWVEDNSNERNSTAFTDIMQTCTNVLKDNTSRVDEFFNSVVANTTFVKKLLATEAFITNLFAKRINLTSGGSIQGGYTEDVNGNPTSGFKLGSDGKLKCVDGIFKGMINATSGSFSGNIDSGPLHLTAKPAGALSIAMDGSEWGYDLYTKLTSCDILPGSYRMDKGAMLCGKEIPENANFSYKYWTTSKTFDTSYLNTYIHWGYQVPIYVLLIPYWENHYYHDFTAFRA